MKVLQLTNKPPWPPIEGGPMAMHAITNALLTKGFDVKVLAVSTPKFSTLPEDVPETYLKSTGYETCMVDTRVRWWQALKYLFKKRSYQINRFFSDQFANLLTKTLEHNTPDIVVLESVFMWPYHSIIRKTAPHALVVLRAHNIEHRIWERIAAGEKNLLKRWYLLHLTKSLAAEEVQAAKTVDAIIPITHVDQLWFNEIAPKTPSMHLPFGMVPPQQIPQPSDPPPPILFYHLGSMDWFPNLEAVKWLITQCENGLLERFPMAKFHLAGRNMPVGLLQKSRENLTITGEVPDSKRFIAEHHVLVAPLFSGSGIRIKILEAMALGKTVITTTVGAEGIQCAHGENILIANSAEEFNQAIESLITNPSKIFIIGKAASKLIRDHYHPATLAEKLNEFLCSLRHQPKH